MAPGSRALVAASIIVVLALPVHAGPFLFYGITPDLSHHSSDAGPLTDDVAWRVQLPGSKAIMAMPLVIGPWVYVLESSGPFTMDGSQNRVHRISVATGAVTVLATLDQTSSAWASDGTRLFVAGDREIVVLGLDDGAVLDRYAYPRLTGPEHHRTFCILMTPSPPMLYAYCVDSYTRVEGSGALWAAAFARPYADFFRAADGATMGYSFVAAYDIEAGERAWSRPVGAPTTFAVPAPADLDMATGQPFAVIPTGVAEVGDFVLAGGTQLFSKWRDSSTRGDIDSECIILVLDRATGDVVARFSSSDRAYFERYREHDAGLDPRSCTIAGEPTGNAATGTLYARFQGPFSARLDGDFAYMQIESFQDTEHETGAGFASDGTHLYAGNWKRLFRFNHELVIEGNPYSLGREPDAFSSLASMLAGDILYAFAHHDQQPWDQHMAVHAVHVGDDDLRRAWRVQLDNDQDALLGLSYLPGLGEGLLVLAGVNGEVVAFGQTAGSPRPVVALESTFPALNETVVVDLSGSQAGAMGAPTEFRVDWGDGTQTDWQDTGIFSHRYVFAGEVSLRAQVRNGAGQSSSAFLTLYPGQEEPAGAVLAEPTWWLPVGLGTGLLLLVPLAVLAWRRLAPAATTQRFEVMKEMGSGAQGRVFLARDHHLDRLVVMKQTYGAARMSEAERRRLLREARNAAKVQHPNVVAVYEFLADEVPPTMVMEYVTGGTLEELLAAGPARRPAPIVHDLLRGLAAIHAAGIVHRDLKPSNVLLDGDGNAKVSDFGVALVPDGAATLAWGQAPGTPAYMAPEQVRGEAATKRSDVYAAAAIVYRIYTGRHHVDGRDGSAEAVRRRILEQTPDMTHRAIPAAVRPVLAKALASRPTDRFKDASAFLSAMQKVQP